MEDEERYQEISRVEAEFAAANRKLEGLRFKATDAAGGLELLARHLRHPDLPMPTNLWNVISLDHAMDLISDIDDTKKQILDLEEQLEKLLRPARR